MAMADTGSDPADESLEDEQDHSYDELEDDDAGDTGEDDETGDADDETEEAEALDKLEAEELEMLTEDEAAEALPIDEAEELRQLRMEAIALETGAESAQEDEFVCSGCFLVKRTSQLANRRKKLCKDCA
jgi:hypothetical protein